MRGHFGRVVQVKRCREQARLGREDCKARMGTGAGFVPSLGNAGSTQSNRLLYSQDDEDDDDDDASSDRRRLEPKTALSVDAVAVPVPVPVLAGSSTMTW